MLQLVGFCGGNMHRSAEEVTTEIECSVAVGKFSSAKAK